jgi:hypothetical protein
MESLWHPGQMVRTGLAREIALYLAIAGITAIGCFMTYMDQRRYLHPSDTFLAFRIAATALGGVVISAYILLRKKFRDETIAPQKA